MSLYRTYRPQNFADVVGQDHIVTTLEQAITQDKVTHAYLFAGSRGTGKTSVARILAKALLTRGITDETIRQQIIKGVEEGTIIDLIEIDAASNRGIDDIRTLVEKIQFSPVAAAAKVYIIDEVHMLTKEAFNALLKTLEEPPSYAYFILATTELTKIPATIQSRCQRFAFRPIREEEIVRRLQYIVDQEHIVADRQGLRAIAHHAQGGMRDAISLLDQLRALPKIGVEEIRERLGDSGQDHVAAVFEAIAKQDAALLLTTVRAIEDVGIPLEAFLRHLLTEIRTKLHDAVEKKEDAASFMRMLDTLLIALRDIRIAPVPGLVLEASLLSLCAPDNAIAAGKTAKAAQERTVDVAKTPAASATPKDAPAPERSESPQPSDAVVEAPELSLENIQRVWGGIIESVTPASVKLSLKNSRLQELKGQTIVLEFASAFHKNKVAQIQASRTIEDLLEAAFKRPVRIECTVGENGEAVPQQADKELVSLAEAAAELFEG